ncbi:MAG TPA: hypothetical protein VLJ58_22270 [Ramlibacter sp.]|nr:hypothetical protein [Ramlibacter sp.]
MRKIGDKAAMAAFKTWVAGGLVAALAACGGGGGGAIESLPMSSASAGVSSTTAAAGTASPSSTATASTATASASSAAPAGALATPATTSTVNPATAPSKADFQVNTTTAGAQDSGAVARLAGGGFVAVWTSASLSVDTDVRFQRFDAQGNRAGGETVVASRSFAPAIAALPGGGFVISWTTSRSQYEANGHAQVFDATGAPVGGQIALAATFYKYVARPAALPDGGFVVAIESTTGKYGTDYGALARYRADGTRVGEPLQLNADMADTRTGVFNVEVTALPDGRWAAAWIVVSQGGRQLMSGVFGANGAPAAAFQTLSADSSAASPSLATLANGSTVLAWESANPAGGRRIEAQVLDGNGQSIGKRVIATDAAAATMQPEVAALPSGGFVAAWKALRGVAETIDRQVMAQRFTATGAPVGEAGQIAALHAELGGTQYTDTLAVTGAAGDGYLVLLGDFAPATSWEIRGALR